jgi:polyisoprenoid-binding protein YceI
MNSSGTQTSVRPPLAPGDYVLDLAHTHVGFVGRHLMVTKVRGTFSKSEARIHVGESIADSELQVTIDVASLDTKEQKRNGHLLSADFFDVEHYPTMTFRATHAEPAGEGRYAITGDLTIRDQTHPVTLDTEFLGTEKTPWGTQAAAISATAEIDREQWGLTWNVALESGQFLVGRKIQLEIDAEVVPAPAES